VINLKILMVSDNISKNNRKIAQSKERYSQMGFLKYLISILDALKEKVEVQQIWVGENGGEKTKKYNESIDGYNIFSFIHATELLENLKPDLVLLATSQEHISRSILIASKSKGIPSIIAYSGLARIEKSISVTKTVPVRINQLTKYGNMFLKKYVFLMRTLFSVKYNIFKIIKTIFHDFYFIMTSFSYEFSKDYADLYICSNLDWKNKAIKNKIPEKKIVCVGEYAYDDMYKKKLKKIDKNESNVINILIITTALVEHGIWKPSMRKELLEKIICSLKNNLRNKYTITFKIHPTAEKLEDYEKIIRPLDKSIKIIQNTNLTKLIVDSQLVISVNQSSALLEVLLLNKPLIIMNIFNENTEKNIYTLENVAIECKTTEELVEKINNGNYLNINSEKIQNFIKDKIFKFDGKCGERAAEYILQLIKNGQ
jgi:hypothetical protein